VVAAEACARMSTRRSGGCAAAAEEGGRVRGEEKAAGHALWQTSWTHRMWTYGTAVDPVIAGVRSGDMGLRSLFTTRNGRSHQLYSDEAG